jgi:hypothetical protein
MAMSPAEIVDYVNSVYPAETRKVIVPYYYTLNFTSLAAGATQSQQLSITANADFLYLSTSYRANATAYDNSISNLQVPFVRILITDSGTNEQFMYSPISLANYCTNNIVAEDSMMPFPRIVSGRSALTIALSSYEASTAYAQIDVVLLGCLVRVFNNP